MTDDRLKPGHCHKCGLLMSDNPHPEAGKPAHYLDVGCPRECIPCLVHSRHQWASRAMKAENEVRDLQSARATADHIGEATEKVSATADHRDRIEAEQRDGMQTRLASRAKTPATADFDLPYPNDAADHRDSADNEIQAYSDWATDTRYSNSLECWQAACIWQRATRINGDTPPVGYVTQDDLQRLKEGMGAIVSPGNGVADIPLYASQQDAAIASPRNGNGENDAVDS